jgi:hypothetical protein
MAKRGNLAKRTSVQVLDYVSSKLSFLRIAILVKLKKPPCGGLFLIS